MIQYITADDQITLRSAKVVSKYGRRTLTRREDIADSKFPKAMAAISTRTLHFFFVTFSD